MTRRMWKGLKFKVPLQGSPDSTVYLGFIYGRRSDDIDFVLGITLRKDEPSELLAHRLSIGFTNMDEYLECDCIPSRACQKHGRDFNPWSQPTSYSGS